MIEFLKMKEEDIEEVKDFLIENKIYESGSHKYFPLIFIIKEEGNILGLGGLEFIKDNLLINNIFVQPPNRRNGLGQGLLRAMLNYADTNGAKHAYYSGENEDIYSFLNKFGFKECEDDKLYIDIGDFFEQPCQGSIL